MPQSENAFINPNLITWARETAGMSIGELSHRLCIDNSTLVQWEEGSSAPSIPQLRKIAEKCKRALACFYLDTPPPLLTKPKDFRRVHGPTEFIRQSELLIEIRNLLFRRTKAIALIREMGLETPKFEHTSDIKQNPEDVGKVIRRILGVSNFKATNEYEAFNQWKMSIEKLGVLVFNLSGFSILEFRGLSVSDFPLPIIAINSKDYPRPKIFSLAHELTHLLIRQSSICNFEENESDNTDEQKVEVFCNMVAGATLLPMDVVTLHYEKNNPKTIQDIESLVKRISSSFYVSQEVVWRRLLIGGFITRDVYESKREELLEIYRTNLRTPKNMVVAYSAKILNKVGVPYAKIVFQGYAREKIGVRDVADYLGTKIKHLPKIREALISRMMSYGSKI
jgi:Zn-dependent peptidase ImmA (M78 family)/DNA-binding XRE family transcriptional regulator